MVWREQTIVWREQTTQRSTEETEKCASRQQERGEVHALTPHHQLKRGEEARKNKSAAIGSLTLAATAKREKRADRRNGRARL